MSVRYKDFFVIPRSGKLAPDSNSDSNRLTEERIYNIIDGKLCRNGKPRYRVQEINGVICSYNKLYNTLILFVPETYNYFNVTSEVINVRPELEDIILRDLYTNFFLKIEREYLSGNIKQAYCTV